MLIQIFVTLVWYDQRQFSEKSPLRLTLVKTEINGDRGKFPFSTVILNREAGISLLTVED